MDDPTRDRFAAAGWQMVDARPLNVPWQRYRDYVAQSRGEFCVAKNGYVRSNCGWFSDRSAMYLALGCPVILQETGWSDFIRPATGLLSFHDEASAVAALEKVGRDPQRHGRAARALAEKHICRAQGGESSFLETWKAARRSFSCKPGPDLLMVFVRLVRLPAGAGRGLSSVGRAPQWH